MRKVKDPEEKKYIDMSKEDLEETLKNMNIEINDRNIKIAMLKEDKKKIKDNNIKLRKDLETKEKDLVVCKGVEDNLLDELHKVKTERDDLRKTLIKAEDRSEELEKLEQFVRRITNICNVEFRNSKDYREWERDGSEKDEMVYNKVNFICRKYLENKGALETLKDILEKKYLND